MNAWLVNVWLATLMLCVASAAAQAAPAERLEAASEATAAQAAPAAGQAANTTPPAIDDAAGSAVRTPTAAPSSVPAPPAPSPGAALEALLAEVPKDRDYAIQRRCIDASRIRRTETLSESFIVFYLRPRTIWVNQLPRPCDGLRTDSVLSIESNERQMCEFHFVEPYNPALDQGGVSCRLGRFEQVTQEQLDAIRQHIAR